MNIALHLNDLFALSPLLILLVTALILLLVETFAEKAAKEGSFWIAMAGQVLALLAALYAPASDNPLLTPWLSSIPSPVSLASFFYRSASALLCSPPLFRALSRHPRRVLLSAALGCFRPDTDRGRRRFPDPVLRDRNPFDFALCDVRLYEKVGDVP